MQVLNEASALSNLLLLSVSDQFELCLAKCRTSSRYDTYIYYILHNTYLRNVHMIQIKSRELSSN